MKLAISIIGTGALGSTLARALHSNGFDIKSLFNRRPSKATRLAIELDTKIKDATPETVDEIGEILFLTVPDGQIADVADHLAGKFDDLSNKVIAHCSGNEASEVLEKLKDQGALTASFHPLQTFHENSDPDSFRNIYVSLEGDEKAVTQLTLVAEALHTRVLSIDPGAKPYLHAAAVVACNYFTTLMGVAGTIAELGGINGQDARKALRPLVETTLENAMADDLSTVLSGPLSRGDIVTIRKHLEILEHNEALLSLYKKLGLHTLNLSRRKGSITQAELDQIRELLSE